MIPFRFQRITRRQGGGDEAYFTRVTFRLYVEEAGDAANKVSQRPGAHPVKGRIENKVFSLPVITTHMVVTYKRIGMRRVVTILLIFVIIITALGCHKETEQDKVKKVITDIQAAAEEKDVKKIINNLAKTYNDPQGFNYETIKGLLLGYFFQYPKILAYITNLEISIENTSAKAVFQTVLTSGNKTGSASDVIPPQSLGVWDFDVSLRKESNGWKVTSAKWEQVGTDEHGGGH